VKDNLTRRRYEGDNYVLDQQVVRAALKSYRSLFSNKPPNLERLTPSTAYLRLLVIKPTFPILQDSDLRNPRLSISLLELRAAFIVHDHAQNLESQDASISQRVSNAVTEAFVATQVGDMIQDLGRIEEKSRAVLEKVFLLVSFKSVIFGN